jgi:hypothetical protein
MTQPPQNPWGNQPPGQPPQQQPLPKYPEVKPLPQGWQQPIIQPPPPQQPMYYQQPQQPVYYQQPQAVKQWPGWATALLVIGAVMLVVMIGVIGNLNKSSSLTTTTTNQQQVVATAGPAVTQRAVQAASTATVATLKLGRVGETLALNGYTVTVNGVEKSENFSGAAYGQVKDGYMYVAIDVTVGSTRDKGISSGCLTCSLKDDKGFKFDQNMVGYKKPLLPGDTDIPAGDKVRGWVTFEVPKTATGLVFEYSQLFESEKIRVALG